MADEFEPTGAAPNSIKNFASHLSPPKPPERPELPKRCVFSVKLRTITSILGGGPKLRKVDTVDIIRAATIRGHLRFWWRALHAHEDRFFNQHGKFLSDKLYEAESAIWGRAADQDGGRSKVDVRVERIGAKPQVLPADNGLGGGYVTWPARRTRTEQAAKYYSPGIVFWLRVTVPPQLMDEVRNAVRAWILFGGYGSRTRRGLGSVAVIDDSPACSAAEWLPADASVESLSALLGREIFAGSGKSSDVPCLAGANIIVAKAELPCKAAWETAINWLQAFRQGAPERGVATVDEFARHPDTGLGQMRRPSISNWPEADKVRHFSHAGGGLPWAHLPTRHNDVAAWPRAGFGLPIIGRFQRFARFISHKDKKNRNVYFRWEDLPAKHGSKTTEPGEYQLRLLRIVKENGQTKTRIEERLASPLIVKAMSLRNGKSAAISLWLNRAHPENSKITLVSGKTASEVKLSGDGKKRPRGGFDTLVAKGDTAQFSALKGKGSLKDAFLDWLLDQPGTIEITLPRSSA